MHLSPMKIGGALGHHFKNKDMKANANVLLGFADAFFVYEYLY